MRYAVLIGVAILIVLALAIAKGFAAAQVTALMTGLERALRTRRAPDLIPVPTVTPTPNAVLPPSPDNPVLAGDSPIIFARPALTVGTVSRATYTDAGIRA